MIVLFTIRANERKARDSNPHSPRGNRVSSAARPTVSGYLPDQLHRANEWTTGESNPDLLVASQASFRWTSSPSFSITNQGPPENRTRSPSLQGRHAAGAPADHNSSSMSQVVPEGVEPPFPLCKRGVVAVGPRDGDVVSLRVARVGVEPTDIRLSDLIAMPVRVPCHRVARIFVTSNCGPGSRTTASELMKLGRAPARPQCPRPRYRAGQVGLMRADRTPATPGSQ